MPRPDGKFVLALFAAGALSFLAGFAFTQLIALIPCRGEGLACNIDQAVVIWAILGPLIFALVLAIARNRTALLGALRRSRSFSSPRSSTRSMSGLSPSGSSAPSWSPSRRRL